MRRKHTHRGKKAGQPAKKEKGQAADYQRWLNDLEDPECGMKAADSLLEYGPACIPDVIERVRYRIAHPIRRPHGTDRVTAAALSVIGLTRCEQSIVFLNELLDDYVSNMPKEPFETSRHEWKYMNVEFFHLLDCMVKQQDKRAIPHIRNARDCFPKNYTDHIICQIAIGRIRKGRSEGYLPMEALEIMLPTGRLMSALSGGEMGWEDNFEETYGEYMTDEDEEDSNGGA